MRLNTAHTHTFNTQPAKPKHITHSAATKAKNIKALEKQSAFFLEQDEDLFDFHAWAEQNDQAHMSILAEQNEAASGNRERPTDNSGNLTRRLVSANNTFIIHRIIGDAFMDLGELRMALAHADDEESEQLRQIIRRLERVVRRGNRKIRELSREASLERKAEKAERDDQAQRAREIEAEMKRQILRRRQRERGYLEELNREEMQGVKADTLDFLDTAMRAKIAAKAQQLAAKQVAASSAGGGVDMFGAGALDGASLEGDSGAEGAVSGELDISV